MGEVSDLICIVDDDASVRRALGRMVRSLGFDVQLLASGRDCLDGPYVDRASCLIVDVMMPNMNGFELHALLAASGRDIPTIFISGKNDQKNFYGAQSASCVAILNKPCDANSLHDAIIKAIAM
ncbi:MAG: response regulator [Proteobacteria bacterium]|nr:response regulator [Pseudomonadota bacterium]